MSKTKPLAPVKILFDMDGVASNWTDSVMKHFQGKDISWFNGLSPTRKKETMGAVYQEHPHVFRELVMFDCFIPLMNAAITAVGVENVGWLSAAGGIHHSFEMVVEDKLKWITANVDRPMGINTVDNAKIVRFSGDKEAHADSMTILIDDYDRNCTQWESAGGKAIVHASGVTSVGETVAEIKRLVFELQHPEYK